MQLLLVVVVVIVVSTVMGVDATDIMDVLTDGDASDGGTIR